jgi:hypothetical protein
MKKTRVIVLLLVLVLSISFASVPGQDDVKIWKEFVALLKEDALPQDRIRPVDPLTPESQLTLLKNFAKGANWAEWEVIPEIVHYENLVSFIVTLGKHRNSPWAYTFNFVIEDGQWYYRFMEGISIPLYKVTSFPAEATSFPDLSEEKKNWIRQESYWSEQVRLFNFLAHEKGKDFAFRWVSGGLANGEGYSLAATVWLPFYPTHRAFILYLCWEQAKLLGEKVTLEKLDDKEAVIRFEGPAYFALYTQSSHLREQISQEDYIKIFESIWQERSIAAGWTLKIEGQGRRVFFRFSR